MVILAFIIGVSFSSRAAPFIYLATATNAAGLQPVLYQFRRDISRGGVNNSNSLAHFTNGWREVGWDEGGGLGTTFTRTEIRPNPAVIIRSTMFGGLGISGSASNPAYFSDIADNATQYYVYQSTNPLGPFVRRTILGPFTGNVTTTSFSETAANGDIYVIRAVKLTSTPDYGSYYNISQGVRSKVVQ